MTKVNMKKFCDIVAKDYALERNKESYQKYSPEKEVISSLLTKKMKILDLCCGPGTFLIPLTKKGFDIEGLDFSRGMIKEAKKRYKKLRIIYADARKIPRKDKTYDAVIFMGNSLGPIPGPKNRQKVLNEVYRVLKDNGILIITVLNRFSLNKHLLQNLIQQIKYWMGLTKTLPGDRTFELSGATGFNHIYSWGEIKKELLAAGFSDIKNKSKNPDPLIISCRK